MMAGGGSEPNSPKREVLEKKGDHVRNQPWQKGGDAVHKQISFKSAGVLR
jgi:hypothetical protein